MPLLDVSEVLSDPLFWDTFSVIRTTLTQGDDGRAAASTSTVTGVRGVVTSNDDDRRTLIPEGQRKNTTINIHTRFALTSGQDGVVDADIIVHAGKQYVVTTVGDYSRYGNGFYFAMADLNRINP